MRANRCDDSSKDGARKETFRDGKVSALGRLVNGKKQGVWKYYFRNGRLKATGRYSSSQLERL